MNLEQANRNLEQAKRRKVVSAACFTVFMALMLFCLFAMLSCGDEVSPTSAAPVATTPAPAQATTPEPTAGGGGTTTPPDTVDPANVGGVTATRPRAKGESISSTFTNNKKHAERVGLCSYTSNGDITTAMQRLYAQTFREVKPGKSVTLSVAIDCVWQGDSVMGAGTCPQTTYYDKDWSAYDLELLEANTGERNCEKDEPECPDMEVVTESHFSQEDACNLFQWNLKGNVTNADRVTVNGSDIGNPFSYSVDGVRCAQSVSANVVGYYKGMKCISKSITDTAEECDPCCDDPPAYTYDGCRVKDTKKPGYLLEAWGEAEVTGNYDWKLCLVAYRTGAQQLVLGTPLACHPGPKDCDKATPECQQTKKLSVHWKTTDKTYARYYDARLVLYRDGAEVSRKNLGACN